MKALMTTDTVGGVWTYCLQLAAALAPHGVRVILAAKGKVRPDQRDAAEACENIILLEADYKLEWMDEPWQDVAGASRWLREIAERTSPDVIHLNDYSHGAVGWPAPVLMVGHSCVLSWHAAVCRHEAGAEWDRYRRHVRQGLQAADHVVAPTRHMLAALDYFYGPLRQQSVVHNGCDGQGFRREGKRPQVFSAGRLWDEAKNISALATAAAELDWPVRVAGIAHPAGGHSGSAAGDDVRWLGQLNARQMAQEYSRASIYALPARYEPFGLTALEAALSGCALVLSDIPTFREIWGDAARYVAPEDPSQLAATINELCRDRAIRQWYARRAGAIARTLTAERMATRYLQLYRQLVTGRQPAAAATTAV